MGKLPQYFLDGTTGKRKAQDSESPPDPITMRTRPSTSHNSKNHN